MSEVQHTSIESMNIDASQFGKVALLLGGDSAEREVSLASGKAVYTALQNSGVDVHLFDPSEQDIHQLVSQSFDRAFIILHGRGGEDGVIQGALQQLGIPYTGSQVLGSALAMDKVLSKQIWHALKLPTAEYEVVHQSNKDSIDYAHILQSLGGVAMVKPVREGSSIGMAKVDSPEHLRTAVIDALQYDKDVLIEQYIQGLEYTVAVLNDQALPSIRMQTPHVFYDYSAKYQDNTTQYFCPSGLSADDEKTLGELALRAFNSLHGKGWGRVDLMRKADGTFLLLESNTVPGMTATSLVPKAAKQAGISFEALVLKVLATSLPEAKQA